MFSAYYTNPKAVLGDVWVVRDKHEEALTKISWAYIVPVRSRESVVYEIFVIRLEISTTNPPSPTGKTLQTSSVQF